MGLSASQARLLTITARKADCEFQSMSLSHQKIALSRDLERFSDEYQNALQKTKLVYDYYGSGTSQMPLSYNLLTTPSAYNDYKPKLITDKSNKVVLNSKLAAACAAAGIPTEGYMGTPSSDIRNKFVEALAGTNAISNSTALAIQEAKYNNVAGLGGTGMNVNVATTEVSYAELLNLIKVKGNESTIDYGLELGGKLYNNKKDSYPNISLISQGSWYVNEELGHTGSAGDKQEYWTKADGYRDVTSTHVSAVNNETGKSVATWGGEQDGHADITLYDLLKDENSYYYSVPTKPRASAPVTETAFMQQVLVGTNNSNSFLNWMTDQFKAVLGGAEENNLALQYAYDQVAAIIYPNEDLQTYATQILNDMENGGHLYLSTCERGNDGQLWGCPIDVNKHRVWTDSSGGNSYVDAKTVITDQKYFDAMAQCANVICDNDTIRKHYARVIFKQDNNGNWVQLGSGNSTTAIRLENVYNWQYNTTVTINQNNMGDLERNAASRVTHQRNGNDGLGAFDYNVSGMLWEKDGVQYFVPYCNVKMNDLIILENNQDKGKREYYTNVWTQNYAGDNGHPNNNGIDTLQSDYYRNNYVGLCATVGNGESLEYGYAQWGNYSQAVGVNLNNLAKAFLTAYKEYIDGVGNYSATMGKTAANLYNPQDDDLFTVKDEYNVEGESDNITADFYDTLFNQICVNGWTQNANIENSEYMQELLKNGNLFISTMNNDNYYYQASYSTDVYVTEVVDTEAVAEAEAKYNAEKAKIENKENQIDLKMKNLDTEISSLNQEYDSIKSLIQKSIEKSFKRYEA